MITLQEFRFYVSVYKIVKLLVIDKYTRNSCSSACVRAVWVCSGYLLQLPLLCVCVCSCSCCAAPKVINSNYITKNNLKTLQHFCKRPTHACTHTHRGWGYTHQHTHTHMGRHTYDFISSYLLPVTCQVFDFISAHSARCCI